MKMLHAIRLWAKRIWGAIGLGSTLIEYCLDCGMRQPVYWWADNSLWSEVMDETPVDGDNMPGVVCPKCFDRRAAAKGICIRWRPQIESVSDDRATEIAHRCADASVPPDWPLEPGFYSAAKWHGRYRIQGHAYRSRQTGEIWFSAIGGTQFWTPRDAKRPRNFVRLEVMEPCPAPSPGV